MQMEGMLKFLCDHPLHSFYEAVWDREDEQFCKLAYQIEIFATHDDIIEAAKLYAGV